MSNQAFSGNNSSLKVLASGSGTFSIPSFAGSGERTGTAVIPHGYGSDQLLFQVSTDGGFADGAMIPWESNDGRLIQYAYIDSTNLTIVGIDFDASGSGQPQRDITYYYRILIP